MGRPASSRSTSTARVSLRSAQRFVSEHGFRNDVLRSILLQTFAFYPGDLLLASDYLDHRNPLTVGPVLDPPAEDPDSR